MNAFHCVGRDLAIPGARRTGTRARRGTRGPSPAMIPSDADENAPPVHLAEDRAPQRDVGERVAERRRFARRSTAAATARTRCSIDDRLSAIRAGHTSMRQQDCSKPTERKYAASGLRPNARTARDQPRQSVHVDEPVTQRERLRRQRPR